MSIRFAAIGLNHNHIYGMVNQLLRAGAELACFYASEPELIAEFRQQCPGAKLARSIPEILEDETIHLVVSAAIPDQRAPLGIRVMRHDKDYMCDKPGFTTLEQLAQARRAQAETGRIYSVFFSERFANPATNKAGQLVKEGAIGRVIHMAGFGPHKLGIVPRPQWFFQRKHFGGILNDLACHQIDQFLYFTDSAAAEILTAQTANFHHPQFPQLEDFGDITLCSEKAAGYIRVDWFTPDGLDTWGDVRLFLTGTDGYIEVRKNCDIGGRRGGNHLFMVNQKGAHYLDCNGAPLLYGKQIVYDALHRAETAMSQEHCFLVSELALQSQLKARRFETIHT